MDKFTVFIQYINSTKQYIKFRARFKRIAMKTIIILFRNTQSPVTVHERIMVPFMTHKHL
jgi:hypothetical protein